MSLAFFLRIFYHKDTTSEKRKPYKQMINTRPINIVSLLTIILMLALFSVSSVSQTNAQNMTGSDYKVRLKPLYPNDPTPTDYLTPTPQPSPKPLINSYGISHIVASENFLQFGPLSATVPVSRVIRVGLQGLGGFSFLHQPDYLLRSVSGDTIPATSCDNGSCTKSQASLWNSTLTYGLGVRCENRKGQLCEKDFLEKGAFRPVEIADSLGDSAILAAGNIPNTEALFDLVYKINLPGSQPPGYYTSTITYILLPTL